MIAGSFGRRRIKESRKLSHTNGDEMDTKRALITGITGQDGSYLAELLLSKGYEVHGMVRRSSTFSTQRIEHILDDIKLHYGDMSDGNGLSRLVREVAPTEVYNLAAQSHVRVSFDQPTYTADVTAVGVCSRHCETFRIRFGFIRHQVQKCLGKWLRRPSVRRLRFILAVPTESRRHTLTGSL